MKFKSLFMAVALSTLSLVGLGREASAFQVQAMVQISPNVITAQVYNQYYQPLMCRVRVNGLRNDSFVQTAFAQLVLAPGSYEYAYVYTNYPFFFMNGEAFADCAFSSW